MPEKTPRTPKYRHHKPSGLAVVRLSGRDIYLGKYDTPDSRVRYDRVSSPSGSPTAGGLVPETPHSEPQAAWQCAN